jgi:hypothetical protein
MYVWTDKGLGWLPPGWKSGWKSPSELFLEKIKAIHEYQKGVRLSYCEYPITQKDPKTGKWNKHNRWVPTNLRDPEFCKKGEQGGSFCLGTARGMAFRSLFGLDLPTYRKVLTDLKDRIETAKKSKNILDEAKALISRVVSHQTDRTGPIEQFNEDLESRYGLKNVKIKKASWREALDALKAGAPILVDRPPNADHWVLVHRSPQGKLWQNDPLPDTGGVKRIKTSGFGSRFEIIVDANTGKPITPDQASSYKK